MSPVAQTDVLTPRKTFFELMRRVEALQCDAESSNQCAARLRRRPAWLHLEQPARMDFATAEVSDVEVDMPLAADSGAWPEVTVSYRHFGLFAPYGPLPLHVTEHAMLEKRVERNAAFERFVNLMCGDLAWSHYAAWAALHPVLGYDRFRNTFAERIASLANATASASDDAARDRDVNACRCSYPGVYYAPHRSLSDLQRMLRAYFGVALRVLPRYGRWIRVPNASRSPRQPGHWRLGSRVWDAQLSLEILIGPIDADTFHNWQRGAPTVRAVSSVVTDFADGRVQPVVKVQVRTRPELAGKVGRMRLGINSWSRPNHSLVTLTVHEPFRDPL